jgi:hypothetical protein
LYKYDLEINDWVLYTISIGAQGLGAVGAVRIIWGAGRSYPSNAANV